MSKEMKLFLRTFLKLLLTGAVILAGLVMIYIITIIISASMQDIDVDAYMMNYSGQIYYKDDETGNFEELDRVYSKENRMWVPILDMPEHLKNAAVAIEDERFYKHNGVDLKRTFGATLYYIIDRDRGYGGSTITQQLVKNLTGQDDRSIARKIKEIFNSFRLERKMSKDQILELYLNTIYLSQGCNGVGAAAHMYFNKEVGDLTIAESAAIVGITQYPTRYDPFLNPDKNKEKKELVLKKMYELKFITEEEYEKALKEKLNFIKANMNTGENFNSYFVDQVITDVVADLVKYKKYDEEAAMKLIHTGGVKIYSTINPKIQRIVDNVYTNKENFGTRGEQSAITIIDPYTGEVKALSGGIGKKPGDFVLNRATMSPRQPGSSIKPIAVYAPAMEEGLITPMSVVKDEAITIAGWSPVNYYAGFKGDMTVLQAVKLSTNIVAVKVLQELGVNKSFRFLSEKLGVSTLVGSRTENGKVVSDKNLPALALGGLTDGITTFEMAAAYSAFVNDGLYVEPHTYTKVLDSNGKVLLEKDVKTIAAMSKKTAQMMCQTLRAVTQSGGTGVAAALPNVATAGKTGTTDDNKDRWFVGFTPYYVGAVWYGYDEPKNMSYLTNNPALNAWKKVMVEVHKGLPYKSFKGVSSNVDVEVCSVSGLLYTSTCVDENGEPTKELKTFAYSEAPFEKCDPSNHVFEPENNEAIEGESTEENTEEESNVETPSSDEKPVENITDNSSQNAA